MAKKLNLVTSTLWTIIFFFTNYLCSGGFQYYGDYLDEKNKPEKKGKKFTYRDFINIQ